ncbi:MAG: acyl-CoA synthetase [Microscillaceae bacterium]
MFSLFAQIAAYGDKTAIHDQNGVHTYAQLWAQSQHLARQLRGELDDLAEARIAFMAVPDARFVVMQWAIWQAGGVAVPVSVMHPKTEIAYLLEDTQASKWLLTTEYAELASAFSTPVHWVESLSADAVPLQNKPTLDLSRKALIIYTSGTTSRPKGVVSTFGNLEAQVTTLLEAWAWQAEDVLLHVLPLHHVHGLINALACPLWVGAEVVMRPRFSPDDFWEQLLNGSISVFMAVPTIYGRLVEDWAHLSPERQAQLRPVLAQMRLMVSGSAALPVRTLAAWKEISGYTLLERYGMTEMGMALSNPLSGPRKAGSVGFPLPGVEVEIVDEQGQVLTQSGVAGEIRVQGANVFAEYWQKPEATAEVLRKGWFYTGDIAERDAEGYFRILGRNNVDIIKTGGYKVSALEIEEVLRQLPQVQACAVIGLPDTDWGEKVAAVLVWEGEMPDTAQLREWTKTQLAPYKVPQLWKISTEDLPRNAMGKVQKPALRSWFEIKE